MINCYQHVKTSIETLDANENFKLYLTYHEGGKKPLLLGMHLSCKDLYIAPSSQVSNHFRSIFRKFGNDFLKKIAPNDYFSIEQQSIEKVIYKSLFCKFIESEKVYIGVVEAHEITQVWDQLLFPYDLSRLFCSGQIIYSIRAEGGLLQRFCALSESEQKASRPKLPKVIDNFLVDIVEMERE